MTHLETPAQALAAAAHTEQPLSPAMRAIGAVLEDAGLRISVHDGVMYADDVLPADPDTGTGDRAAAFEIKQVD